MFGWLAMEIRTLFLCGILASLAVTPCSAQGKGRHTDATPTEFRALWVDAFHAGIRSPQEADQLVMEAQQSNFNALIVQVRRRGDALYLQSFEPSLEDAAYDPTFDA